MNTNQDGLQPQLPSFEGYRTKQWLGSGGFADVYLVEKENIPGSFWALKQIKQEVIAKDPVRYRRRFNREVQLQIGLHQPHRHPHIVKIDHYDEQQVYLVMDYASGGTLEKLLNDEFPGGMDLQTARTIVTQIGLALAYMHEKTDQQHTGIMHLDLKPKNILIQIVLASNGGEERSYLVADFSMAHELLPEGQPQGGSSLFDGTDRYMAPEQAAQGNAGIPDPRTDIYTLGVILHQMLSGKLPQPGEQPPPLRELENSIPPEVEAVVQKATAKRPENRYGSMRGFVRAFNDAIDISMSSQGNSNAAQTGIPAPDLTTSVPDSAGAKWLKKIVAIVGSPYYSIVATVVLLILVAVLIIWNLPKTYSTQLGGVDLKAYCASIHYKDVTDSLSCSSPIDMTAACRWQWSRNDLIAQAGDQADPYSWSCHDSQGSVGGISDMDGYCKHQGYYGITTAIPEDNKTNNWICHQMINVAIVCTWQYNRIDVQAHLNNEGQWKCYGL
jgi:serine/threonine protein kinase